MIRARRCISVGAATLVASVVAIGCQGPAGPQGAPGPPRAAGTGRRSPHPVPKARELYVHERRPQLHRAGALGELRRRRCRS